MVDVTDIAPDAQTKEESDEEEHIWRVLGYGNPGTGKTHFGFSMPGPVFCIDTEGKAGAITQKFDKEIYIFSCDNYDDLVDALSQALDALEKYQQEEGVRGTIMVDTISDVWDMAQQKYMEMAYPGKDPNEVNFQSALQAGGESDWQSIKRLHNERFREQMIRSDFHVYWTAKSEEDYGAILSGEGKAPRKPQGEKNNIYKATEILHFFEGEEGRPTANLKKSALTKWKFGKFEYPTFPQVQQIIESIVEAESSPEDVTLGELKSQFPQDVDLYDGDPDLVYMNASEDE